MDIKHLWALKLYALMYRQTYKDIVDLYFILKNWYSLTDLLLLAEDIFSKLFKPEFSIQNILDRKWDKSETIKRLIKNPPSEDQIKQFIFNQIKNLNF